LDANIKKRINDALVEALNDPIGASDHLINRGAERKIRIGGLRILFRIEAQEIFVGRHSSTGRCLQTYAEINNYPSLTSTLSGRLVSPLPVSSLRQAEARTDFARKTQRLGGGPSDRHHFH
jgi:hypothetical protein